MHVRQSERVGHVGQLKAQRAEILLQRRSPHHAGPIVRKLSGEFADAPNVPDLLVVEL